MYSVGHTGSCIGKLWSSNRDSMNPIGNLGRHIGELGSSIGDSGSPNGILKSPVVDSGSHRGFRESYPQGALWETQGALLRKPGLGEPS